MKTKSVSSSRQGRPTAGRRSFGKRSSVLFGGKHNRCVILPTKLDTIAESIERKQNSWFVRTKEASDLIVRIGSSCCFHLHMIPMVSRSGYLNRFAFHRRKEDRNRPLNLQIDNFPGGAEIFELVTKFCYGWKVDLTPSNIVPLCCAADFLEMSDDLETGNLISRTQTFLSFVLFTSWKDTFLVLKTCESFSSWATALEIQTRCSKAIVWKVFTDPKAIALGHEEAQCFYYLANGGKEKFSHWGKISENWWFEDVSALRIDHFIEVVVLIKKGKRMKPELLGSCITYWTAKWLSRVALGAKNSMQKGLNRQVRRVTVESLIKVLPDEDNSLSCNFLLHLLKVGSMMNVDVALLGSLEKRIALMLEHCHPLDLLVRNYGESCTLYDVKIIARVVEASVSISMVYSSLKVFVVARLVDGFLTMIAKDDKLPPGDFQLLAESLPKNARYSNDNLYGAIDKYLKAHPDLIEEEQKGICRAMEYHKLSQEAREHALKNERLPLNVTVQLALLEQVNMARSIMDSKLNYQRAKEQELIVQGGEGEVGGLTLRKEVEVMHLELDRMKVQMNRLRQYKVGIKNMMNLGICSKKKT